MERKRKLAAPSWGKGFGVDDRMNGAGFIYCFGSRVGWIQSHSGRRIVMWLARGGLVPTPRQVWAIIAFAQRYWDGKDIRWSLSRDEQVRLCDDLPKPATTDDAAAVAASTTSPSAALGETPERTLP